MLCTLGEVILRFSDDEESEVFINVAPCSFEMLLFCYLGACSLDPFCYSVIN
jgi:hypothetical protein